MAYTLDPAEKRACEQLLGLTGTYDKKKLKKAYYAKIQEWHPDLASRNGHSQDEANAMTAKINDALVKLTGILPNSASTATCEPEPSAAGAATGASTSRATTGQTRQQTTGASRQSTSAYDAAPAGSYESYDYDDGYGTEERQPRGAVPRNMAAARRYTNIVTDSGFIRLFVSGIGPHVLWAVLSLAVLAIIGATAFGAYGPSGILLTTRLLPIAVLYDIATGGGAEVIRSIGDMWAVNKAVRETE